MLERFSWIINHHQPRLGAYKVPITGAALEGWGWLWPEVSLRFWGTPSPRSLSLVPSERGDSKRNVGYGEFTMDKMWKFPKHCFFGDFTCLTPCETLKSGRGFVVVIQTCSSKNLKWIGESTEKKKVGTTEHVSKIKFEDVWDLENDCFWVSMWFVLGGHVGHWFSQLAPLRCTLHRSWAFLGRLVHRTRERILARSPAYVCLKAWGAVSCWFILNDGGMKGGLERNFRVTERLEQWGAAPMGHHSIWFHLSWRLERNWRGLSTLYAQDPQLN